jgi:hypothetical protein
MARVYPLPDLISCTQRGSDGRRGVFSNQLAESGGAPVFFAAERRRGAIRPIPRLDFDPIEIYQAKVAANLFMDTIPLIMSRRARATRDCGLRRTNHADKQ